MLIKKLLIPVFVFFCYFFLINSMSTEFIANIGIVTCNENSTFIEYRAKCNTDDEILCYHFFDSKRISCILIKAEPLSFGSLVSIYYRRIALPNWYFNELKKKFDDQPAKE